MLTQRLAEFAIETKPSAVPGDVMDAARDALIDTLGVGIVGSTEEVGEIALRYVSGMQARREASVWGTHVATTMAEAAFVNGVFGHALDFDDVHASVHGHPSTTMIPAALAAGEAAGASGEALLAAYAGYEELAEAEHPRTPYPEILRRSMTALGKDLRAEVTAEDAERLAMSVPDWPAFEDSPAALAALGRQFKLIILSNVDRLSFAGAVLSPVDRELTSAPEAGMCLAATRMPPRNDGIVDRGIPPPRTRRRRPGGRRRQPAALPARTAVAARPPLAAPHCVRRVPCGGTRRVSRSTASVTRLRASVMMKNTRATRAPRARAPSTYDSRGSSLRAATASRMS